MSAYIYARWVFTSFDELIGKDDSFLTSTKAIYYYYIIAIFPKKKPFNKAKQIYLNLINTIFFLFA